MATTWLADELRRGSPGGWRDDEPARTSALEATMAERLEAAHAVAVSSPMVGFQLAYRAVGPRPDAAVLTSSLADPSVVRAAIATGCRPRFADVDAGGHLSADRVREHVALRGAPGVVVASHHAGHPCDTTAIAAAAAGALLIEDAVDALGAIAADGRPVGAPRHGGLAIVGIRPVRASAPAQGAVLLMDDPILASRCRSLRDERSEHRLSELHAALGLVQLGRIDAIVAERARVVARYAVAMAAHPFATPLMPPPGTRSAWWSYLVRAPVARRTELLESLRTLGFAVRDLGVLLHRHPFFGRYADVLPAELPETERLGAESLVLPTMPVRSDSMLRATDALASIGAAELRRVAVAG
jgi:perosamine synthetase